MKLAGTACIVSALALALLATPARAQSSPAADAPELRPLSTFQAAPARAPSSAVSPAQPSAAQRDLVEDLRHALDDGRAAILLDRTEAALALPDAEGVVELQYLAARAFYAAGRIGPARRCVAAVARVAPGHVDALLLGARAARLDGDEQAAIRGYVEVTQASGGDLNNPGGTLAWLELGITLAQGGFLSAALESLAHFDDAIHVTHMEHRNAPEVRAALERYPHAALDLRLALLGRLGRMDERVALAQRQLATAPDDADLVATHLETLRDAGRDAEALRAATRLLTSAALREAAIEWCLLSAAAPGALADWIESLPDQLAPADRAPVGAALADALHAHGLHAGAVRAADRLAADLSQPRTALAYACSALADRDSAESVALRAARARDALARCLRAAPVLDELPGTLTVGLQGVVDAAALEALLRTAPVDSDYAADLALGMLSATAGRLDAAARLFESAAKARPDCTAARVALGQMLAAAGDWQGAKAHARQLLAASPRMLPAMLLLALAQDGLDENEQAQDVLKDAIRLHPGDPRPLRALARQHERLDNLLGAQRYFGELLNVAPGDVDALESLLDCYLREGKRELVRLQLERSPDAAAPDLRRRVDTALRFAELAGSPPHVAELEKQAARFPADFRTRTRLAEALLVAGNTPQAIKLAQQLVERHGSERARLLLARAHATNAEFGAAADAVAPAVARYPNRAILLWAQALYSLYDFRLSAGRDLLRRAMERADGRREQAENLLLRSHVMIGEVDQALALIDDWSKAHPGEQWEDARLNVLNEGGRAAEAFERVAAVLERRPEDRETRALYVKFGSAARRFDLIAARLASWLAESPGNAAIAESLVEALVADRQFDAAGAVVRAFPDEQTFDQLLRHTLRARIHSAAGRADDALAEFDAALAAIPPETQGFWPLRVMRVHALLHAARFDEARQVCREWEAAAGIRDQEILLRLRRDVAGAADDDAEYAAVTETLLKFNPQNPGYQNDLGYTWLELDRKLAPATLLIRRAVAAEPWNAAYLDSLGWAYYKQGDFAAARVWLGRATSLLEGRQGSLLDHRGDAEFRSGDSGAAAASWEQAAALFVEEAARGPLSKRDARVQAQVSAKLAALRAGEPPPVAPLASPASHSESAP